MTNAELEHGVTGVSRIVNKSDQCKGINNERQVDTEKSQQKTQQSGKCGETQSHVLVYCWRTSRTNRTNLNFVFR